MEYKKAGMCIFVILWGWIFSTKYDYSWRSFLKKLLSDFGYNNIKFKILEDNQSVIKITENNDSNKRLKHIDIKYQYIVEKVSEGFVNVEYISTNNNVADILNQTSWKTTFLEVQKWDSE